jgi:hypothetical protein
VIREIHKRLVEGVRGGEGGPGAYRSVQNLVVNSQTLEIIYTPPPKEDVPPLMRELVDWLRAESPIHPVLVAGIAQFQLVHIHPFLDGNGRTSRLLSTLSLYRAAYDFKRLFTLSEFYDRDRTAFYQAIQSVRGRDMDLTGWLQFFVAGLATHAKNRDSRTGEQQSPPPPSSGGPRIPASAGSPLLDDPARRFSAQEASGAPRNTAHQGIRAEPLCFTTSATERGAAPLDRAPYA